MCYIPQIVKDNGNGRPHGGLAGSDIQFLQRAATGQAVHLAAWPVLHDQNCNGYFFECYLHKPFDPQR